MRQLGLIVALCVLAGILLAMLAGIYDIDSREEFSEKIREAWDLKALFKK